MYEVISLNTFFESLSVFIVFTVTVNMTNNALELFLYNVFFYVSDGLISKHVEIKEMQYNSKEILTRFNYWKTYLFEVIISEDIYNELVFLHLRNLLLTENNYLTEISY